MNSKNMHSRIIVLYIDDDEFEHELLRRSILKSGENLELISVFDIPSALPVLDNNFVDLVMLDNRLQSETSFCESVPKIKSTGYSGPISIVSSYLSDTLQEEFNDSEVEFLCDKENLNAATILNQLAQRFDNSYHFKAS